MFSSASIAQLIQRIYGRCSGDPIQLRCGIMSGSRMDLRFLRRVRTLSMVSMPPHTERQYYLIHWYSLLSSIPWLVMPSINPCLLISVTWCHNNVATLKLRTQYAYRWIWLFTQTRNIGSERWQTSGHSSFPPFKIEIVAVVQNVLTVWRIQLIWSWCGEGILTYHQVW
jgi:hypothetical protein